MKVITADNLTFRYHAGHHPVLEHLTFNVEKGTFTMLIGPNGGGKTTLIKLISGILPVQEGVLSVEPVRIGYVPQNLSRNWTGIPVTIREIVSSGRTHGFKERDPSGKTGTDTVESVLDQLQLTAIADTPVQAVSGGQFQRSLIARALAGSPEILILDEPTIGVDAGAEKELYALLHSLQKSRSVTILFVTHDIDIVTKVADQVLCINTHLQCNMPAESFQKESYIHSVYGESHRHLHHTHKTS